MSHTATARTIVGLGAAVALGAALSSCSVLGIEQGEEEGESVFTLAVGDCTDTSDSSEELSTLPKIPCDEPHTDEVYLSFEMEDDDWPGDDAIQAAAEEKCLAEFDSFAGIGYDDSVLDWWPMTPTQAGWEDASLSDREVLCLIYDTSTETVSESLEGAAR